MKKLLYFFLLLLSQPAFAQNDAVFRIDSLETIYYGDVDAVHRLTLDKLWKYHKGDDSLWALPDYDDKSWPLLSTNLFIDSITEETFSGIGWFRIHLQLDSSLIDKTLGLLVEQSGASEIYLDGKRICSFGTINASSPEKEERFNPQEIPVDIRFEKTMKHVIAVRYAYANVKDAFKSGVPDKLGFELSIGNLNENTFSKYVKSNIENSIFTFYFTFFLALGFLHLMLFLFFRENKSNLYYSIFNFFFGAAFLLIVIQKTLLISDALVMAGKIQPFLFDIYSPAILAMLYVIFYNKLGKLFWLLFILFFIDFIAEIFSTEVPYLGSVLIIALGIELLRVIVWAIAKKKEGAWIIATGILTTIAFFTIFIIISNYYGRVNFSWSGWTGLLWGIFAIYATLSIPVSMSVYLAHDFAKTNKKLKQKLVEVENLSAKTLEQEKEKQKILEFQKETLELQVTERTAEIVEQKAIIEAKNKDITDSINYARTIQKAILPTNEYIKQLFPDSFILFKPKDIVSGDFYWFTEKNGKRIVAACDCTGHGVPGGFMSMIGNNLLNHIVNENGCTSADEILNQLNKEMRKTLKQELQDETRDGMDSAVIVFHSNAEIEFAGAQRPLWVVEKAETGYTLNETKGDKFAIGGFQLEKSRTFSKKQLHLSKGTSIYIFSDGFADQFSADDKKLMTSRFKELILKIQDLSMDEQERHLGNFIDNWRGKREQIDDILVIGIRI
ncbi:MAG: SpoIIE family protein phosphatase [Bacteroidia bacterium]